jgi:pimeloyl-ACP methyl ester carboxylesterase
MTTIKHFIILLFANLTLFTCGNFKEKERIMVTKDFEFLSGNKKLSGFIDQPAKGDAGALIMFVHGSGPTNIRMENRYIDLRERFIKLGITCVVWDKPGNGRSEGQFDQNQPVAESAQEVLDAIAYLRSKNIPGYNKIGIWGTSRGGWVVPIVLSQNPSVKFWISVAGVPAEEQKYYLLESNLPLEGHTQEETQLLLEEWVRGKQIFMQGGSYNEYLNATQNLRKDTSVVYFAGDLNMPQDEYEAEQKTFLAVKDQLEFNQKTLSMMVVRDFDSMLKAANIDVLALFGEKDTNVNWRKTKRLYESTIGKNPNASLTIRTFPDANHSMNISKTGSVREVEGRLLSDGEKAEGYYEIQLDWLRKYVLAEDTKNLKEK